MFYPRRNKKKNCGVYCADKVIMHLNKKLFSLMTIPKIFPCKTTLLMIIMSVWYSFNMKMINYYELFLLEFHFWRIWLNIFFKKGFFLKKIVLGFLVQYFML